MKRSFLAVVLCFAFASIALAQDTTSSSPATKEDVERYLQAMHSHEMMQNMLAAMARPLHQMVHDQFAKQQDRLPADFEARMDNMLDDMMKNMPFDEMIQSMVPTYQKHFTKGDMDALITFYSSPTGQKILREMPAVTSEAMATMMPIMRKQMEAMNQRIERETAEMLKDSKKNTDQDSNR